MTDRRVILQAVMRALSPVAKRGAASNVAAVMSVERTLVHMLLSGKRRFHDGHAMSLADGLRDLSLRLERLADQLDGDVAVRHIPPRVQSRASDGSFARAEA